ncbi:glycosyltransferase [Crossiella sp. CA-258035]|uniref:glycosyltransferase n=1 Tax=Crossiella sp. CA-258035 TaxID=2981138 RepID=UPI0024BC4970|nr:glycosyltransferase [Crossiella sp. CA-258035]WHT15864.1 glycosyltransferase [Crossiella sp. CA-258035]
MIDVMFVPYAAHGHVNPLLPVLRELRELRARGHRVRVLVGPAFAEVVAGTGVEVVAVPVGFETWVPDRFRWAELGRLGRSARTRLRADSAGKALLRREIERRRPDVVVWDAMSGWAGRLARAAGVPAMVWSTTYAVNDAVLADTARHRPAPLRRAGRHRGPACQVGAVGARGEGGGSGAGHHVAGAATGAGELPVPLPLRGSTAG